MIEDTNKHIAELNHKMDLLLEYANEQRLKSVAIEDLIADVSIVGKDIYDSTVNALDKREIEIEPNELRELGIRFIKNINNFNIMLDTLASITDLVKDAGPVANEILIDTTKKLYEFEEKGYFEFLKELGRLIDNIVTHYSEEDVRMLADNIVVIMDTLTNLTQPKILKSVNNAAKAFAAIDMDNIPEYSVWKIMREVNKPEMKRAMGFFMTLIKETGTTKNN
ncbi:MAG TPA: DUF1641 domain-containing protein [Bacteroidaceae bacterium]|nr:DUF1641 domain-containing protein [Bacteroidaceae bacterium]